MDDEPKRKPPRSIRFPDDIEADMLALAELDRRAFNWLAIEAARLMVETRRADIDTYRARQQQRRRHDIQVTSERHPEG